MNFISDTIMFPSQGNQSNLIELVEEILPKSGQNGWGTNTVFIGANMNHHVVIHQLWESVGEYIDAQTKFMKDKDLMISIKEMFSLCSSHHRLISQIIQPASNPVGEANFVHRNVIKAKRGYRNELVKKILDITQSLEFKPAISVNKVGDNDNVMMRIPAKSIDDIPMLQKNELGSDDWFINEIRDLTVSSIQSTARIFTRS